jgi:alpha,alpha-trehalase
LATPEQARTLVGKILPQLEFPFGLSACAPGPRDRFSQWEYPNGWPCTHNLVYRALDFYGYQAETRRIAGKYVATVSRCFEETGDLWEKYNVADGTVNAASEAGYNESTVRDFNQPAANPGHVAPPSMMGWTAGVFLDAAAYLDGRAKPLGHQAARV